MKMSATILLTVMLIIFPTILLAQSGYDAPTTVRLGGMIVEPGTSTHEVIQKAGEPLRRENVGINMKTGEHRKQWIYPYRSMTAVLHISGSEVTRVEKLRGSP